MVFSVNFFNGSWGPPPLAYAHRRYAWPAEALSARIAERWDDIRAQLRRTMIPSATLADVMTRAGCPQTAEAVGVTSEFYRRAVRDARFLRDRYTFLDLAADSARLGALS